MSEWNKTSCVLCAQNCGLEVRVENNRMVKVRPDKDNPRSEGYACRKGLKVAFHQHHSQRLNHPLKKVNGEFQRISWDPAWNRDRRACTAAMHSRDAQRLGLEDGRMVRVVTEAGRAEVELEVDDASRPGTVIIPHGFGLMYEGREQGVNVNRLTRNTHRDPLAGTPLHRYVPCRVEAADL